MAEFDKYIKLEKSEYKILALALKTRVDKSNDTIDIKKCIRKLILNFNLLKRNVYDYNLSYSSFEINHKYYASINDNNCLKSFFNDIYKKLCYEIEMS